MQRKVTITRVEFGDEPASNVAQGVVDLLYLHLNLQSKTCEERGDDHADVCDLRSGVRRIST